MPRSVRPGVDPLEGAAAVVQAVAEDVYGGLVPGDEPAVIPDELPSAMSYLSPEAARRSNGAGRRDGPRLVLEAGVQFLHSEAILH